MLKNLKARWNAIGDYVLTDNDIKLLAQCWEFTVHAMPWASILVLLYFLFEFLPAFLPHGPAWVR